MPRLDLVPGGAPSSLAERFEFIRAEPAPESYLATATEPIPWPEREQPNTTNPTPADTPSPKPTARPGNRPQIVLPQQKGHSIVALPLLSG